MIEPILPERFAGDMALWIEYGVAPGGFLQAVLTNDLRDTFARADYQSVREVAGIVSWLYNEAPAGCWGSPADCAAWYAARRPARQAYMAAQGEGP